MRRSRLAAGAAVAAVLVQVAIAQVTLGLAAAFIAIGALSRWRPSWLFAPCLIGLCWVAAIGASRAWTGYAAAASHVAAFVTAPGSLFAHIRGSGAVVAGWRRWLLGQVPAALVVAAAEAGVIGRLTGRRVRCRPGLVVAARRGYAVACVRRGEVATADGCCVGVSQETGRRAAMSWRDAEGGALVTGLDAAAVTGTCLDVVAAAILHRKSVLVIDMTDGTGRDPSTSVLRSLPAVSAKAAAPCLLFGPGRASYEPFGAAGPAGAAGLVTAMADWAEAGPARRAFCADYVRAALEVIAADARAPGDDRRRPACVLDDLTALLRPGALPARLGERHGAVTDPGLRGRVGALASRLAADPSATAPLAVQLSRLRRSAAGEALCPPRSGAAGPTATSTAATGPAATGPDATGPAATSTGAIRLAQALAERQVIVFPLDLRAHGPAAVMVARLVIADLARVLTERDGVPADCLVWINGCEGADLDLAVLAGGGRNAGVAMLLSTASGQAARALADRVNVVMVRGRPPRGLAADAVQVSAGDRLPGRVQAAPACRTALAGESLLTQQDHQVLPAELLAGGRADALAVLVRGSPPRLVPGCRVVS